MSLLAGVVASRFSGWIKRVEGVRCEPRKVLRRLLPVAMFCSVSGVATGIQITQHDIDAYLRLQDVSRRDSTKSSEVEMASLRELLSISRVNARERLSDPMDRESVTWAAQVGALKARLDLIEQRAADRFDPKSPEHEAIARERWVMAAQQYKNRAAKIRFKLAYFSDRKTDDLTVVLDRVLAAQKALDTGAAFDDVTKTFADPDRRETIEFTVTEAETEPHVWRILARILKPDEVSRPLMSAGAILIVKLIERIPVAIPPFEQVKDEILKEMRQEVAAKARVEALDALRARAGVGSVQSPNAGTKVAPLPAAPIKQK